MGGVASSGGMVSSILQLPAVADETQKPLLGIDLSTCPPTPAPTVATPRPFTPKKRRWRHPQESQHSSLPPICIGTIQIQERPGLDTSPFQAHKQWQRKWQEALSERKQRKLLRADKLRAQQTAAASEANCRRKVATTVVEIAQKKWHHVLSRQLILQ